jgi:hypothetical protein
VIGNGYLYRGTGMPVIAGESGKIISNIIRFPLVGERENFDASEYIVKTLCPKGYDFVLDALEIQPREIVPVEETPNIEVFVEYMPERPMDIILELLVENPMTQLWHFRLRLVISTGPPVEVVTMEAGLNKAEEWRPTVRRIFAVRTPCRAYFAQGSASEFTLSASEGFIEPSINQVCQLPFVVQYAPKMYGKVMKGLLVIDTLEAEWTFELIGKVPDYRPPVIEKSGRIDVSMPASAIKWAEMKAGERKRSVIKQNIESAKFAVPRTSLQNRPGFTKRPVSATGPRAGTSFEKN